MQFSQLDLEEEKLDVYVIYVFIYLFYFSPLSCPALWQQNCNLNTFYAKQVCFAMGCLEGKAPLDAHQLPIYLFLLQYLTCDSAKPDRGTGKEEEQRRRNRTKIERKTRQPAATPVKTKQTTIHGFCGESSLSATRGT